MEIIQYIVEEVKVDDYNSGLLFLLAHHSSQIDTQLLILDPTEFIIVDNFTYSYDSNASLSLAEGTALITLTDYVEVRNTS